MREIREVIFRGKRLHDNKWIYGNFVSDCEGNPHIIEPRFFCEDGHHLQYEDNTDTPVFIIPETVGQFTGLTDKNGRKIFEGDILDVSSDVAYGGVAVHRLGYFVVEFHNGCFMKSALDDPQLSFFDNAKRKGLYHFISTDIHKIVGNIHDNPDILKGGGDNG